MGTYDVAQICLNGHLATKNYARYAELRKNFCQQCGQETIHQCGHCNTPIRGDYHVEGFIGSFAYDVPAFCFACGKPYPWTARKIYAAQALADEIMELNESDRLLL